ncbi:MULTISPECIES: histidine kinase dimerization/phospho-acceptor domain-containing protein [unclassified Streptomyces]|uniref:histidine kinase dimerization/phospho-acceptor domain-containing protein n=1 Tax=unclassified Streptomyces TaxID=2593676 RepID=UPI002251D951|nr:MULTISPECIES: histidine kinase dimerization/phospho-acceptor domain-containing protein [unclassified Streptomyces]MCX5052571.1 hypothetical protein [Streptomyces sp. NBC_00474]
MRTPLTGLQLALEAGLAQDDDARLRPVLTEALATTHRLHHTVEEVLRLSRAREASRPAAGKTAVRRCCGRPRNGGTACSPGTADAWSAPHGTHRPMPWSRACPCRRCSASCWTTPGHTGAAPSGSPCGTWTVPSPST